MPGVGGGEWSRGRSAWPELHGNSCSRVSERDRSCIARWAGTTRQGTGSDNAAPQRKNRPCAKGIRPATLCRCLGNVRAGLAGRAWQGRGSEASASGGLTGATRVEMRRRGSGLLGLRVEVCCEGTGWSHCVWACFQHPPLGLAVAPSVAVMSHAGENAPTWQRPPRSACGGLP